MPISYQRRREIWLEMAKAFPPPIDKKVSLRNIQKVAKLSLKQQKALAQAVSAGLTRIPTALRYLETNPEATQLELLEATSRQMFLTGNIKTSNTAKIECKEEPPPAMTDTGTPSQFQKLTPPSPKALEVLVGLLKDCYPDMNLHSAQALAESQALRDVLDVLVVYQQVFDSPHFNTDFVVVLFHKLLERTWERLNRRIAENPAYQKALRLSSGHALRQAGVDNSANQGSVDQ